MLWADMRRETDEAARVAWGRLRRAGWVVAAGMVIAVLLLAW